jgi:hypothetical protein
MARSRRLRIQSVNRLIPLTLTFDLCHRWAEECDFTWLISEEILDEYEVLRRLGVRPNLVGTVINLIRERAQGTFTSRSKSRPDAKDDPFSHSEEGTTESSSH